MAWEKALEMFPEGHTRVGDDIPVENLPQYDQVKIDRIKMARHMVAKKGEVIWNSDNTKIEHYPYDLTVSSIPDGLTCLNVFGWRMVYDELTKKNVRRTIK